MKYLFLYFLSTVFAADDNAPLNRTKDRHVDIKHIKINVSVDLKTKSVFGYVTHTLSPLKNELKSFTLDGDDMIIRRVRMKDQNLEFNHSGNKIHIELPNTIGWNDTVDVRIDYSAYPRKGTYFLAQMKPIQISHGKLGRRVKLKIITIGFHYMIIPTKGQLLKRSLQ